MEAWIQHVVEILPDGISYLPLIGLVAFFESIPLLGLAMPGSSLIILAGFLAAHGKGDPATIILCSSIGAFSGDACSFWLGKRFGVSLLKFAWLNKPKQNLQDAEKFLGEHGGKSLFYARFLGPIRGTIPFLAGMARMRTVFFCKATLVNAILWGMAYPGLGYLGGESWQRASDLSSRLGGIVLLAFGASLFHLWLKRKTR
jgi:undecaprenyl-diphosphatase